MRHCIVVMYENAAKEPYKTGWMSDRGSAFQRATQELTKDRVAWICWSYYYRHSKPDSTIKNQLRELAKSLVSVYQNTVPQRRMFKLYSEIFRNPVFVLHQEVTQHEVVGFAYAQCVWRGAPADKIKDDGPGEGVTAR